MATATKTPVKKVAAKSAKPTTTTAVAIKKPGNTSMVSIADIQAQLKAQAAAGKDKIGAATGIGIRTTQDKKFILPDGSRTEGPLKVVIIDFASRNEFYEGSYDPNNISPPACFAISPVPANMAPSDNSPVKQADTCGECPMNVFGSAGNGKACKNMRILAVLPPDADESTPMWTLKVSPTAIKGFDGYVGGVARTFEMPPISVVTEVSFDETKSYASLVFGNPEVNENLGAHFGRQQEAADLLAQEPDVSGFGEAQAKVNAPKARPRVAAKTAVRR